MADYGEVRKTAKANGKTVHFGRVFPLCAEAHSELPSGHRTHKCRVVFQGSFVSEQNANVAVFEELASSASLREDRRHRLSAGIGHTAVSCTAGLHPERAERGGDMDLPSQRPVAEHMGIEVQKPGRDAALGAVRPPAIGSFLGDTLPREVALSRL